MVVSLDYVAGACTSSGWKGTAMTEAEWLVCDNPTQMVRSLQGRGGSRRPRLWTCAFFRWYRSDVGMLMRAVHLAEAWADGEEPTSLNDLSGFFVTDRVAWRAADRTVRLVESWEESAQRQHAFAFQLKSLYCIFGNPFRPVSLDRFWLTPTLTSLATAAYEERILPSGELDPARLAVLSDALEEAGCDDADILSHLRSPGPHVRGCWALDLVLSKA